MNILLTYPEFPDTFWSLKHALKFIFKKATLPPLGLLTVAAMLPKEWSKRLVDLNLSKLKDEDIIWADYVFISSMIVQKTSAGQIIDRCNELGVKVVAGGPLFTSEFLDFDGVDHLVLNEAEITIPIFLSDLEQGKANRIYRSSDFADVHTTPVPLWELADMNRYASLSIQYTRGCPFQCEFCNVTVLFGHRPRIKTSKQIIDELDTLYNLGWRGAIFFVDDNFIGNKNILKTELLPALMEWQADKTPLAFFTEVSINLADDGPLMDELVNAGFETVFVGIETPDEDSLAECGKKQNRNRNLVEDVRRMQRAGIQVQGGFVVGFDNDKTNIFQRQIDFIQNSGIVTAMVGLLQAPPGTRLYDRLKKEGRLQEVLSGDNADGTTNIIPKMSIDALKEGYHKILHHIYAPEHYYQRIKTFLSEYKLPKTTAPLTLVKVQAFVRSVYHLGIKCEGRGHYWKLMFWTYQNKPKAFSLFVTLSIYGLHFRKICKLHVY